MLLDKLAISSICSVVWDSQIRGVKMLCHAIVYETTIYKFCSCWRSELTTSKPKELFYKLVFRLISKLSTQRKYIYPYPADKTLLVLDVQTIWRLALASLDT